MMSGPKQQQGVALISVLLVFALVTLLAAQMLDRSYLDMRRAGNLANGKQAYYLAVAGEEYGRQLLARDYQQDKSKADTLVDLWAQDFDAFQMEEGELHIEVSDLQGRFNLNNVISSQGGLDMARYQQLKDLLNTLELPTELADVLVDWVDQDRNARPNGAEDSYYMSQTPAYLAANRPLTDISELRLLKGMEPAHYTRLKPYVSALPSQSKYNINTLNATMLEALLDVSGQQANSINGQQQEGDYKSVNDWLSSRYGDQLRPIAAHLTAASEYFEVISEASFVGRRSVVTTRFHRDKEDGKITVLSRHVGRQ